jgi:hypothetical protein
MGVTIRMKLNSKMQAKNEILIKNRINICMSTDSNNLNYLQTKQNINNHIHSKGLN